MFSCISDNEGNKGQLTPLDSHQAVWQHCSQSRGCQASLTVYRSGNLFCHQPGCRPQKVSKIHILGRFALLQVDLSISAQFLLLLTKPAMHILDAVKLLIY